MDPESLGWNLPSWGDTIKYQEQQKRLNPFQHPKYEGITHICKGYYGRCSEDGFHPILQLYTLQDKEGQLVEEERLESIRVREKGKERLARGDSHLWSTSLKVKGLNPDGGDYPAFPTHHDEMKNYGLTMRKRITPHSVRLRTKPGEPPLHLHRPVTEEELRAVWEEHKRRVEQRQAVRPPREFNVLSNKYWLNDEERLNQDMDRQREIAKQRCKKYLVFNPLLCRNYEGESPEEYFARMQALQAEYRENKFNRWPIPIRRHIRSRYDVINGEVKDPDFEREEKAKIEREQRVFERRRKLRVPKGNPPTGEFGLGFGKSTKSRPPPPRLYPLLEHMGPCDPKGHPSLGPVPERMPNKTIGTLELSLPLPFRCV
ncbi:hypothetical protein CBR_g39911 [Chara braunii]|uniref:Uncharacterized protein n=1 Tax=Chara braunii TaxID=69332 RepID=A0A388K1K4_CHABU|nr:hypothetical protein CBR_g39911 [Chara braunii]|eukprot:GBG63905.1 hypothetical protein CBR_g39911 [Chara braunii]